MRNDPTQDPDVSPKLEVDPVACGARIKELREGLDISAAALARAARVTATQLWKYEAGKNVPGTAEADAIARRLRTTTTWLLWGDDVPALPAEDLYPAFADFLRLAGVAERLEADPWKREQIAAMRFKPGEEPSVQSYLVILSGLDLAEPPPSAKTPPVTPKGDTAERKVR